MNKKLFKIVICGIPVVLGCITACSALSTIASKEQEEKEVDLPEEVLTIDEDNALTGWNNNISWSNKNTYEKYCMCNTLLVPKRVTVIKNYSFYRNIPDFVTTLKFESESLCTKIESNAFWNDLSLKKIVLPSSLTTIEDSAFADCMNIKTMDMSMCRRISSIGDYVIKNCRKITKFSFPENNDTYGWATNLGPNAKVLLQKDSQGKTVWDDTKTIVGSIGLGQIIFPEGIERISKFPATLATKITLPSSLKFLGDGDSYSRGTFESCGALVTVDMSKCNNLKSIHQDSFKECYSLKNVIWCQKNNNFGFLDFQNGGMLVDTKDSLGNWVINGDTTPVGRLAYGDIVVSNPDLTTIKNEQFERLDSVTSFDISGCTSLTSIEQDGFYWSHSLKKIKFPDSLKSIGRCAFEECGIEELILPEGFEEIKGGYSFAYTLNLKTISFPSTINKIDSQSFYFENEMSTDRLKSPSQICEIIWNNLSKDPTGTFSSSSFVVSANGGTIKSNTTHGYTSEQLLEYCKANFYAFKNNWDAA